MRKISILIIFTALVVLTGVIVLSLNVSSSDTYLRDKSSAFLKESERSTLTIFAVGDIMLDRGVEYMIEHHGGGDYNWIFSKALDLKEADILFGNLEGPVSNRGDRVGSIYSFRFEPESVKALKNAGFNILSLSNNHMFDYNYTALDDTFNHLENNNIDYVGAGRGTNEAYSIEIKEIKGTKIGFLSYTNLGPRNWRAGINYSGIAWIDEASIQNVKSYIKEARERVDVLIVSLHAGVEYQREPTDFQRSFSRNAIDAGADIVLNHHSHVIQPIEEYNGGTIYYGLGNFVFDQSFSKETMEGLAVEITTEEGKVKEVIPKKIKINDYFQPVLDD